MTFSASTHSLQWPTPRLSRSRNVSPRNIAQRPMPKRLHKRCQCFRPPINIQCKDCCCAVVPGPNFSPKEVHHVGILSTRNRRPKAQHSGCHLSRTETANRDGSNFSASQKHIDYRTWRGDILGPNCNTKAGKLFQKFQHRKGTQNIEYRAWCGAACRQGDEESQISDYARIKNRIEHGNRTSGVSFPGQAVIMLKGPSFSASLHTDRCCGLSGPNCNPQGFKLVLSVPIHT